GLRRRARLLLSRLHRLRGPHGALRQRRDDDAVGRRSERRRQLPRRQQRRRRWRLLGLLGGHVRTLSALLLLLLLTGCACGPGPRARHAVDEARAKGAETYAPGELQRALQALEEAARSEGADRDRLHE